MRVLPSRVSAALLALVAIAAIGLFTLPSAQAGSNQEGLDVYEVSGNAEQIGSLHNEGFDFSEGRSRYNRDGFTVDAVLSGHQRDGLRQRGFRIRLKRDHEGRSPAQEARRQDASGFNIWKPFDGRNGFRALMYRIARKNPDIVKLVVLGRSVQGREMIALKVTQGARKVRDGKRPAVALDSLTHAREWISGEVNLRTLRYFVDKYRENDREVRRLLKTRELWFVLVVNPDGYQYTHDTERLWRKNLRDNDNDGQITPADGVDINRNFNGLNWGYENEGSSPDPFDETYRGPSPASEPETRAMQRLYKKIKPVFLSTQHSVGGWLLYGPDHIGLQDADNPIMVALAGTDADPAIEGFDPGPSSDTLYITNGATTSFTAKLGTIGFTPELSDADSGGGFVFPDDEELVQKEFERVLPFSLGLVRSATRPDDPVSPVGIKLDPFYLNMYELDPQLGATTASEFTFQYSYGDPQKARILARRSLGKVTLNYKINNGRVHRKKTTKFKGGERYGQGIKSYYHVVEGEIRGTNPGDSVKVWFSAGKGRSKTSSDSFTYTAVSETNNDVLILAAEDYSGASPGQPTDPPQGPLYLSYYQEALGANGIAYDVYDVDALGRVAPDALGVLSHYRAVIWYTGDDVVTRTAGYSAGNGSRLAMREMFEVRDFLNEGGRVLYTGQGAGQQYTPALGTQLYDPFEDRRCVTDDQDPEPFCVPMFGSGDSQGDVMEYFFGAGITTSGGGVADLDSGSPFNVLGTADPLNSLSFEFNGVGESAENQFSGTNPSFVTTTDLLKLTDPTHEYPLFESENIASWVTGGAGGALDPHSGTNYLYSQMSDESYKRLTRTISGGGTFSFWASFNTELDFDYMIVEARTPGGDDWTTLQDTEEFLSDDLSTEQSCLGGWSNPNDPANLIHPHLTFYQTFVDGTTPCEPVGSGGGHWYGVSGSSSGWHQLSFDLSAYAGSDVEISITYVTDWGFQQFPGIFIDDIEVDNGGAGTTSFEDDGDQMDGWVVSGAPQDPNGVEESNRNDWIVRDALGIKEGSTIRTPDTIYMGYGIEGITGADNRAQVMGQAMGYLLRPTQ